MKRLPYLFICLTFFAFMACQEKEDTDEQDDKAIYFKSKEEKKKDLPFSDAVQLDNLLFLSGQIGMDHSSRTLVEGGIEAETIQVFKNIASVLNAHGSSIDHIIKATVILADIEDFSAMNAVYKKQFKDHFPVRTTIAADLVAGAKIEIEVIATVE